MGVDSHPCSAMVPSAVILLSAWACSVHAAAYRGYGHYGGPDTSKPSWLKERQEKSFDSIIEPETSRNSGLRLVLPDTSRPSWVKERQRKSFDSGIEQETSRNSGLRL